MHEAISNPFRDKPMPLSDIVNDPSKSFESLNCNFTCVTSASYVFLIDSEIAVSCLAISSLPYLLIKPAFCQPFYFITLRFFAK